MNRKFFLIAWDEDLYKKNTERMVKRAFSQMILAGARTENIIETFVVPNNNPLRERLDEALKLYEAIADFIEAKADCLDLRNSVVIVDSPFFDLVSSEVEPNPLNSSQQIKSPLITVMSMLSLSFPEVRWIFYGGSKGVHYESLKRELVRHPKFVSLFDPFGLRNYIRTCMNTDKDTSKTIGQLPTRESLCASIDEEESYAFLHAYIAYKLGYRCQVVTTEAIMSDMFSNDEIGVAEKVFGQQRQVDITFEDMFLGFPDRQPDAPHLSDLSEREEAFPGLQRVQQRIFVTVGHKHIGWHDRNQEYIGRLKNEGKTARFVYKPTGGLYNLLESGKLLEQYQQRRERELFNVQPRSFDGDSHGGGHSAPGRLLLIAERLISRADKILKEGQTVQDCLHGATLALEAQELLSYRTPTISLEAIALRHQLEVKAECMFYGVGYSKHVKSRLNEIENEVEAIVQWFHPSLRPISSLNAQMSIATEVIRILREYGQFDEEQQCLSHLRKLHRRKSLRRNPWLAITYPIRSYIEILIGSFPLFIVAILFWPVIFGIIGYLIDEQFGVEESSLSDFITHSFIIFFGLQPSGFPKPGRTQPLTVVMILMGFAHLGIFVSHLYTLISRR